MSHPLLCWDIIQEGRIRREEFAKDLQVLSKIQEVNQWNFHSYTSLENALIWENKTILVTSPELVIVFVTKNMAGMTGYMPSEVIGKTPKMFQGPATQEDRRQQIRQAITDKVSFECDILNYRKNGSVYQCRIQGYPVFNTSGSLVHFLAMEEERKS